MAREQHLALGPFGCTSADGVALVEVERFDVVYGIAPPWRNSGVVQ
jgi:hypothetical protein